MASEHTADISLGTTGGTKRLLIVLSVLLMAAWAAFAWYYINFKRWADVRETSGVICSVAAGTSSDGRDIVVVGGLLRKAAGYGKQVVCYDADSGKILWEHGDGTGENYYFNDVEQLQMWVAVDARGDVFTASRIPREMKGRLEKRSEVGGDLLWSMDFSYPGQFDRGCRRFHDHMLPPVVNRNGNLWVLRTDKKEQSNSVYLSLVSGRSGEVISDALVVENLTSDIRFMDLIGLDGGGAVVFHAQGKDWHASHYSEHGNRIGDIPLDTRTGEYAADEVRFFVDEGNQRIFVCNEMRLRGWTASEWTERKVHMTAYSMTTGGHVWESSIQLEGQWGTLQGKIPEMIRLRPDGDLELRHGKQENLSKINWRKWTLQKGLPRPVRKMQTVTRNLRTIVSGVNGSHGAPETLKSSESWFYRQGRESGPSTKEEKYNLSYSFYEAVRCRDSRRWLPGKPDASGAMSMECYRMIRCSSGRVVLTRDPRDFQQGSRDKLWQVRSMR